MSGVWKHSTWTQSTTQHIREAYKKIVLEPPARIVNQLSLGCWGMIGFCKLCGGTAECSLHSAQHTQVELRLCMNGKDRTGPNVFYSLENRSNIATAQRASFTNRPSRSHKSARETGWNMDQI